MAKSPLFHQLRRSLKIANFCQKNQLSTEAGREKFAALESQIFRQTSRRKFLTNMGKWAAVGTTLGLGSSQLHQALAAPKPIDIKVAIIGAGLAGLACGYELKKKGINATLFEASNRTGGRCYTLGGAFPTTTNFPGQVAERGGEFIDNLHKTLLGYAKEFRLELEDFSKQPGEVFYYINNQRYSETAIVAEFRQFVDAMRDDLRTLSGAPTAANHTQADRILDFTPLDDYLNSRGAGNLITAVIDAAYTGEYGLNLDQQSCLNLLLYIHADRRSKFRPFGVYSDERYHIVGGNQQIAVNLQLQLPGQIQFNKQLIAARKDSANKVELTFADGFSDKYDLVVFAIPFSTLRQVDLDETLNLPQEKRFAIANLTYGTNSKLMVGFERRPWLEQGGNGSSYADLPHLQGTWETNPIRATSNRAILTDYTGGNLGALLNPNQLQQETSDFLNDLNRVFPGSLTAARRNGNDFAAYLENWRLNPLFQGSYTCNQPGYFTNIADNEGKPVDNLYFIGEHANSFYEWQGFMEGAALSGVQAASQIVRVVTGNNGRGA
ncbi:MAG: FAD-dependent oxidoreductase [Oscillatoria sp. PMC 1068.18]|nr:FAD-dependent oxidoreductase [Oscillatoria sp. PMC 1076.18]MEC4990426.1 FAD-dependent oxidoreductase [Oscillatoria sp. PMC 1068.18]